MNDGLKFLVQLLVVYFIVVFVLAMGLMVWESRKRR